MREGAPISDGIDAGAENPTIIVPGTGGGYEHVDLPIGETGEIDPSTAAAYQATIERDGFPADVMVGETLVRPSTAGRSEHIDLPLGEEMPGRSEAYDRMVTRDGFPLPDSANESSETPSQEVDLEV